MFQSFPLFNICNSKNLIQISSVWLLEPNHTPDSKLGSGKIVLEQSVEVLVCFRAGVSGSYGAQIILLSHFQIIPIFDAKNADEVTM